MRTLVLLGALLCAGTAGAAGQSIFILPCSPATCGGFPQNQATMVIDAAWVYQADPPGQMNVRIGWLGSPDYEPIPYKVLKVYYGAMVNKGINLTYLGDITVVNGAYDGPIWNGNAPYLFPSGSFLTGHFYFNDMSVPNTQFVTGLLD
jgi:hypothetical protein